MHNEMQKNLEFQLQWCETNLRYLCYEENPNDETIKKIAFMRKEINRINTILSGGDT